MRNIQFIKSYILFNIGSIDTKLEIFRNFKVLFPLRGSRVVYPITKTDSYPVRLGLKLGKEARKKITAKTVDDDPAGCNVGSQEKKILRTKNVKSQIWYFILEARPSDIF